MLLVLLLLFSFLNTFSHIQQAVVALVVLPGDVRRSMAGR